jgi:hypothetical protein
MLQHNDSSFIFSLVKALFLLSSMFFLNYLSILYIDADLFKLDLTQRSKNKIKDKKIKRLIFVLKNSYLLFVVTCFLQTAISVFFSDIISNLLNPGAKIPQLFIIAIFTALITEVLVRYLVYKTKH